MVLDKDGTTTKEIAIRNRVEIAEGAVARKRTSLRWEQKV